MTYIPTQLPSRYETERANTSPEARIAASRLGEVSAGVQLAYNSRTILEANEAEVARKAAIAYSEAVQTTVDPAYEAPEASGALTVQTDVETIAREAIHKIHG